MKHISFGVLIYILVLIIGCSEETVNNPGGTGNASDLTRTGKFIAFTSNLQGNYDIYLAQVNSSGVLETTNLVYNSNPFNLTSANPTDDKQANWSPNGRVLVFSRTTGNQQEIYAYFFNADGSRDSSLNENPRKLFSSNGNWDNNPSYSPDGARLIWDRREDNQSPGGIDLADARDLMMCNISGYGDSIQVSGIGKILATVPGDEFNPKWSPRISVRMVAYENQSSPTATDHDVWVIDPMSPGNNNVFYNPNNSGYPAWAPACDRIIFESDKSSGDFWKIVSLGYPSNNNTPSDIAAIANVHLRYPTWLPNGGLIGYIRLNASNNGNIYIVSSSGGTPFKLLESVPAFENANNLWPAW